VNAVTSPVLTIVPPSQPHEAASVYTLPLEYHGCSPDAARPCEPGLLLRCTECGHFWAPCTQTSIDLDAVEAGRWTCAALPLEDWP
jgi:hypothetical protein